jgi:hypothetical protein
MDVSVLLIIVHFVLVLLQQGLEIHLHVLVRLDILKNHQLLLNVLFVMQDA